MTLDDGKVRLNLVENGPQLSGRSTGNSDDNMDDSATHPSVTALLSRYRDSVLGHKIFSGSQHVVWINFENNLEILKWLRDDQDHCYDMISDVTAVDYGAGRPIEVVYQLFSTVHKRALRIRCALPHDGCLLYTSDAADE